MYVKTKNKKGILGWREEEESAKKRVREMSGNKGREEENDDTWQYMFGRKTLCQV